MSIIDDVLSQTDEILGIRDEIGAVKYKVCLLTRTWSGEERGEGSFTDVSSQVLPSPRIVDYSHSLKAMEGGNVRIGDLLLKMISAEKYPKENLIDCSVDAKNIEKWYLINGYTYEVVSVVRKFVYWNVMIRKTIKNRI